MAANRSRASTRVPRGLGAGRDRGLGAVLDDELQGLRRAPRARVRISSRATERDRRQRLAAEAERRDGGEIAVGQLGRRVALDRERQVGGAHAGAVVDDADEAAAAGLDGDVDRAGAGVERVLDQLLDRRRRPLDHLAGGDAVDEQRVEAADGHALGLADSGPRGHARRVFLPACFA